MLDRRTIDDIAQRLDAAEKTISVSARLPPNIPA